MASTSDGPPQLFVLAGPNGAGKSTTARTLLPGTLGVDQFVNADNIAAGLSPFAPQSAVIDGARVMLERIEMLVGRRESFGIETTLAGRTTASLVRRARDHGYFVSLTYLWLSDPSLAVQRVADRVALGGHHVPHETIVRRYHRGLTNFWERYRPLVHAWTVCDNSGLELMIVAQGNAPEEPRVADETRWAAFQESVSNARA